MKKVISLEEQAHELLKQKSYTYIELTEKIYGDDDPFHRRTIYRCLTVLRKKGYFYYPIEGAGTKVYTPKNNHEAEMMLDYVSKRSFGIIRSYVRAVNFLETKFKGVQRLASKKIDDMLDIVNNNE